MRGIGKMGNGRGGEGGKAGAVNILWPGPLRWPVGAAAVPRAKGALQ